MLSRPKNNMLLGTTYATPTLSDEDAYDVAGFIDSAKAAEEGRFRQGLSESIVKVGGYTLRTAQHKLGPSDPTCACRLADARWQNNDFCTDRSAIVKVYYVVVG